MRTKSHARRLQGDNFKVLMLEKATDGSSSPMNASYPEESTSRPKQGLGGRSPKATTRGEWQRTHSTCHPRLSPREKRNKIEIGIGRENICRSGSRRCMCNGGGPAQIDRDIRAITSVWRHGSESRDFEAALARTSPMVRRLHSPSAFASPGFPAQLAAGYKRSTQLQYTSHINSH